MVCHAVSAFVFRFAINTFESALTQRLFVIIITGRLSESYTTYFTNEILFSDVTTQVISQTECPCEAFLAQLTFEQFDALVWTIVFLEIRCSAEQSCTKFAGIWFFSAMNTHVWCQICFAWKFPATRCTLVRFNVMHLWHMQLINDYFFERFTTNGTVIDENTFRLAFRSTSMSMTATNCLSDWIFLMALCGGIHVQFFLFFWIGNGCNERLHNWLNVVMHRIDLTQIRIVNDAQFRLQFNRSLRGHFSYVYRC